MKNLVLQIKEMMVSDWKDDKRFEYNEFNNAIKRCDQLQKRYGDKFKVRIFDLKSQNRVYPYRKDATGNEIIPNFNDYENI